jgi:hypothetical protein
MGAVSDVGVFSVKEDGKDKPLLNVAEELPNTNPFLGKPFRNVFERDRTNPYSAKADLYARPIAMFLQQNNPQQFAGNSKIAGKSLENVSNLINNGIITDLPNGIGQGSNRRTGPTSQTTMPKKTNEMDKRVDALLERFGIKRKDVRNFVKLSKKLFPDSVYLRYLDIFQ